MACFNTSANSEHKASDAIMNNTIRTIPILFSASLAILLKNKLLLHVYVQ